MAQPDLQVLHKVDIAEMQQQQDMTIQQLQQNHAALQDLGVALKQNHTEEMQKYDRIQQTLDQVLQRLDQLHNGIKVLHLNILPTNERRDTLNRTPTDQLLNMFTFASGLERRS